MSRTALLLGLLLSLAVPTLGFAQQAPGPVYGPHMRSGGWHGWFFWPIMMFVFIAVAVVVVVLLVRWLGPQGHGGALHAPPSEAPMDILQEWFARGEFDKEEFEERRRVLSDYVAGEKSPLRPV